MPTVQLNRTIINQILSHAQQSPEAEVCGLISRRDSRAERIYRVANVAEAPGVLFRMDPEGQIEAMRSMRERGEELFAIYHSHPHAPAQPSPRDLAEAAYPEALFLIVSLDTKGVLEMRAFYLRGGEVEKVDLETIEG
jgi:proteasome lid subunit RPN8/RPN11